MLRSCLPLIEGEGIRQGLLRILDLNQEPRNIVTGNDKADTCRCDSPVLSHRSADKTSSPCHKFYHIPTFTVNTKADSYPFWSTPKRTPIRFGKPPCSATLPKTQAGVRFQGSVPTKFRRIFQVQLLKYAQQRPQPPYSQAPAGFVPADSMRCQERQVAGSGQARRR